MEKTLKQLIESVIASLFSIDQQVELTVPEDKYGDFATNIALQLASLLNQPPRILAEQIIASIELSGSALIEKLEIAGPGFINLKLSNKGLQKALDELPEKSLVDKTIVAEYSDANPFKILHAGHLYTSIVGDSMANLMEQAGAKVHRVNFGGDVGLHVAKSIYSILENLGSEDPSKLEEVEPSQRSEWMTKRYVEGNTAYEENYDQKQQIKEINKRIFDLVIAGDHQSDLSKIYWTCRQWSYDYFNQFYARINIAFEKYYPESEVAELGLQKVKENVPDVYQESDGAIIFDGQKYGLFTNVFINSQGLPTYAAKDVGLIFKKWEDYKFDRSIIITSFDQVDYMKVVLKSIEQFRPDLVSATTHLSHGRVKLSGGRKMSSRLGNFLRATDVLDAAREANKDRPDLADNEEITLGAVKYSFLKQSLGADIIYDPEESISLEGNSGPYLQYAHARAKNILSKAGNEVVSLKLYDDLNLTEHERSLIRKLSAYSSIVNQATNELKPHYICTYLYELAQVFNRFYENSRVIGDSREDLRLSMVSIYAARLASGLALLGISAPDKM